MRSHFSLKDGREIWYVALILDYQIQAIDIQIKGFYKCFQIKGFKSFQMMWAVS